MGGRERLDVPARRWPDRDFLRGTVVAGEAATAAGSVGDGAVADAGAGGGVVGVTTTGRRGRITTGSFLGVKLTRCQSGVEASFRNPVRSGSRSISEAITAGSILICWLVVVDDSHCRARRDLEVVV